MAGLELAGLAAAALATAALYRALRTRVRVRAERAHDAGPAEVAIAKAPPGIALLALDGRIEAVNPEQVATTGLSRAERLDPVTGLPAHPALLAHLADALRPGAGQRLTVLVLGVDDPGEPVGPPGRGAADGLLAVVGARLRDVLRDDDLLARIDGDAFAVVVPRMAAREEAVRLADRLVAALRPPVVVGDELRFITASVGVRLHAGPPAAPAALVDDAVAAARRALERGGSRVEVFEPSLRAPVLERLERESGLRRAFERGELRLRYQAQVRLATGRVAGVEALARWQHPGLGLVPAARFVGLAERRGLGAELDAWALAEACREAAGWERADLVVAVNVCPAQVARPELAETVRRALADSGLEPGRLCLEVPEAAILADPVRGAAGLRALAATGARLAVDDAGADLARLAALATRAAPLPIDVLKVDRPHVAAVTADAGRAVVLRALRLAAELGATVIAEGVEHPAQVEALHELGCPLAQGHHFAPPVTSDGIARLLEIDELGELVT
jgi:diguanylate cyclase (GGDEF)-like protein